MAKKYDRLKDVVYAGFAIDFIFASFSHFSVNDDLIKVIIPLVMLGILTISYKLKDR